MACGIRIPTKVGQGLGHQAGAQAPGGKIGSTGIAAQAMRKRDRLLTGDLSVNRMANMPQLQIAAWLLDITTSYRRIWGCSG